jgi:hypothetical protein
MWDALDLVDHVTLVVSACFGVRGAMVGAELALTFPRS